MPYTEPEPPQPPILLAAVQHCQPPTFLRLRPLWWLRHGGEWQPAVCGCCAGTILRRNSKDRHIGTEGSDKAGGIESQGSELSIQVRLDGCVDNKCGRCHGIARQPAHKAAIGAEKGGCARRTGPISREKGRKGEALATVT